jgi:hypothetical protein
MRYAIALLTLLCTGAATNAQSADPWKVKTKWDWKVTPSPVKPEPVKPIPRPNYWHGGYEWHWDSKASKYVPVPVPGYRWEWDDKRGTWWRIPVVQATAPMSLMTGISAANCFSGT